MVEGAAAPVPTLLVLVVHPLVGLLLPALGPLPVNLVQPLANLVLQPAHEGCRPGGG